MIPSAACHGWLSLVEVGLHCCRWHGRRCCLLVSACGALAGALLGRLSADARCACRTKSCELEIVSRSYCCRRAYGACAPYPDLPKPTYGCNSDGGATVRLSLVTPGDTCWQPPPGWQPAAGHCRRCASRIELSATCLKPCCAFPFACPAAAVTCAGSLAITFGYGHATVPYLGCCHASSRFQLTHHTHSGSAALGRPTLAYLAQGHQAGHRAQHATCHAAELAVDAVGPSSELPCCLATRHGLTAYR